MILFFNTNDLIHFKMIRSFYIGISILGVLLLSIYFKDKFPSKFNWIKSNFKIKAIAVCIFVFFIQIIFAKSIYFSPGWDVNAIIQNAEFIISDPESFQYNYFMMYPNNIFLLLIFSKLFKLSQALTFIDYRFLLVVINIIMVDLAIIVTTLTAKKLFNSKYITLTVGAFGLLFSFSPWIVVPYSDTLSMVFPITILYLYIIQKEIQKKSYKIIIFGIMGILAAIGFQIKPTVIIVLIAILIAEFFRSIKSFKRFINFGVCILAVLITFIGFKVSYNKSIENLTINGHNLSERENIEVPFTHFAMMGMQSVYVENRGTIYGAYDPDDVTYTQSFPTKEEKVEANIQEIKKRFSNFGVLGYLEFIWNKINWFLSDGTFYYGGEGNFMISEPYMSGNIASMLQNTFLHTGDNFLKLADFFQGVWILILFLIVYPIFEKDRFKEDINIVIFRLTITGLVLFLALFEARSRYLINHLPIFIVLATFGFSKVYARFLNELEN